MTGTKLDIGEPNSSGNISKCHELFIAMRNDKMVRRPESISESWENQLAENLSSDY